MAGRIDGGTYPLVMHVEGAREERQASVERERKEEWQKLDHRREERDKQGHDSFKLK